MARGARILPIAVAMVAVALGACGAAPAGPSLHLHAAALPASATSHVIVIVMENEESPSVIGSPAAPYINSLVRRYGLAGRSYGVTHPSLPNYLALTSGSTQGATSDCTSCHFDALNLVDQFQAARISWRAYLEGVPSACFKGAGSGGYAKKHNPFIYYDDVAGSPSRCGHLVGFGVLAADLRAGRLPTFAWLTPNLCDDMHDCSVATGDRFLARIVPSLLRELGPAGPGVRSGARSAVAVDEYGVLRTIEDALGLPALGAAAQARNGTLDSLFTHAPKLG
jgi:hypothetical protein